MNDDSLVRRVLEAVPAGAYEMSALLSLLRVEASAEVATAAVSCEARPVLRVNPAFVERHCRSDEHLFVLVMHELHHRVAVPHAPLPTRPTPAHNLASMRVINSLLCALPGAGLHLLFLDNYGARRDGCGCWLPSGADSAGPGAVGAAPRGPTTSRPSAQEVFERVVRRGARDPGQGCCWERTASRARQVPRGPSTRASVSVPSAPSSRSGRPRATRCAAAA